MATLRAHRALQYAGPTSLAETGLEKINNQLEAANAELRSEVDRLEALDADS